MVQNCGIGGNLVSGIPTHDSSPLPSISAIVSIFRQGSIGAVTWDIT
jgi:hypothetical protein